MQQQQFKNNSNQRNYQFRFQTCVRNIFISFVAQRAQRQLIRQRALDKFVRGLGKFLVLKIGSA